jgi:hypothetical protein
MGYYKGDVDPNDPLKNWIPSYPGDMPSSISMTTPSNLIRVFTEGLPLKPVQSPDQAVSAPSSDGEWSKVSDLYNLPIEERMRILQSYTGQQNPLSKDVYGPDAVWQTRSGAPIGEGQLLKLIELSRNPITGQFANTELQKYLTPTRVTGAGSTPAYVYAAQADNYQASAELARAQAENIPVQQQIEREKQIAAAAAAKFGQGAQLIGLQTGNQELANRGADIAFNQGNLISQAQNRIQELALQQQNLQQQYNYNTSAANSAASNAAAQFNAQMGFSVEQANVAAQQRKQEQLQSLARDISESAKAPGDYGKLAALTLANAGWGQEGSAIGKGADLRTEQSLAPLESQLRTRQDVMAAPDRPFSYTPITPTLVQAPVIEPVDVSKFAIPQQTLTMRDVQQQQKKNALDIANLGVGGGQISPSSYINTLAGQLQSGTSSADVNAALNAAIAAQTGAPTGYQGEGGGTTAAATGGIIPRYEDGGVILSSYKSGGPSALFQSLRNAGVDERQATEFVNTVMNSDIAARANEDRAAAQQAQMPAPQQQYAPQMPQRPYQPATPDAGSDTEAELLRLGMEQPYRQPYIEGDFAPNVLGWTPPTGTNAPVSVADIIAARARQANAAPKYEPLRPNSTPLEAIRAFYQYGPSMGMSKSDIKESNKEALSNIINGIMAYPGGGAGVRGAGSLIDLAGLLRNPRTRVLMTEYAPAFDEIQRAFIKKMPSVGYATGGIAPGAYISGERGPELNIPLGDKTIVLNQKQMKAAGIDLKKLMSGSKKPEQFAGGGVFDTGWGNVQDQDRTLSMQFLNDALARARAGTPFQEGALPAPVYASSPGFSPLVTQVLGSLTSMAQGVPTEYFQELAAKYRPSGIRESVTQRSA